MFLITSLSVCFVLLHEELNSGGGVGISRAIWPKMVGIVEIPKMSKSDPFLAKIGVVFGQNRANFLRAETPFFGKKRGVQNLAPHSKRYL